MAACGRATTDLFPSRKNHPLAKPTPQQRLERYRRSEERRRGFHDQIAAIAAEPRVQCTALITSLVSPMGYRLGKLTAGQPIMVPRSLVDLLVAQGIVSFP